MKIRQSTIFIFAISFIVVLAGAEYAYQKTDSPTLPKYGLNVNLSTTANHTEIGKVSIDSYRYNISSVWFNSTLKAYSNYTITFSFPVAYGGVQNETAHVYLKSNVTALFSSNVTGIPEGAIYIK